MGNLIPTSGTHLFDQTLSFILTQNFPLLMILLFSSPFLLLRKIGGRGGGDNANNNSDNDNTTDDDDDNNNDDATVPLPTIPLPSLPPQGVPIPLSTIPLPSLPSQAKGDVLPLPSLPPQSKRVPLPSLPPRSKGDPLLSLPSLPPENKGVIPIPSSPKGDQLDLLSEKEYGNDDNNIRNLKQPRKPIMRLIAAHTVVQSSQEGSAFDQIPVPSGPQQFAFTHPVRQH